MSIRIEACLRDGAKNAKALAVKGIDNRVRVTRRTNRQSVQLEIEAPVISNDPQSPGIASGARTFSSTTRA